MTDQKLAFGIRELSHAIDVSPRFLWDEIAHGRLTPTRLGKRVLITGDEARAYLARNTQKSEGDSK